MKVGLIGLGVMGRNHLRVLQENPNVEEVVVFDKQAVPLSNQTKVRIASSLSELGSCELDYAVIALPTAYHLDAALLMAEMRTPTLIEKPVASNLAESESIAEAFAENGTLCRVGHVERFNPALRLLKSKLGEGVIGRPLLVTTRRVGPFPHRINDVGVVRDLASHDIDLAMWLSGQRYSDIKSLTSKPRGADYEDVFMALGQLGQDVSVSHTVNWLTPTKTRETSILGTEGLLVADSLRAELRLYKNGTQGSEWGVFSNFRGVSEGEEIRFVVPVKEPLVLEHEAMQAELQSPGSTDICSIEDGLEVMRVIKQILGD